MKFSNIALLTLSFFTLSALAAPVQQEKRGLKSCYKHAKLTQYVLLLLLFLNDGHDDLFKMIAS